MRLAYENPWRLVAARGKHDTWWTRTQRIRTAAEIPFEAALLQTAEPPLYQRIAPKTMRLWELGLSLARIARHLAVTNKTVAKSLAAGRRASRLQQPRHVAPETR